VHTYPHSLLLRIVILVLLKWDDAYVRDDPSWMGMIAAAVTYCVLPGFLTSHRLRSLWRGGRSGALVGVTGVLVAAAIHGLIGRDATVLLNVWFALLPGAGLGFMMRTMGAAVAQPRLAVREVQELFRQPCTSLHSPSAGSVSPPPPRPPQDHRQPRHGARHRQQLAETLPPPLAVGHVRQHLANEALTVAWREEEIDAATQAAASRVIGYELM
jgi:hypothetical protein